MVNPSTQFKRDLKERQLLDSHMITVKPNHYWHMVQKLRAKIKKNSRDKLIGGNTLPLDSVIRMWLTNLRDRPDAV